MRMVGLTGGISSGKSTVSNIFKANDIPIVDADVVARDVLKKGTGGWKKVVKEFGEDILQPNGEVDRPKLGQIVFSDPYKRQILNRLLAPYISSGIFKEVFKLWLNGSKVIVLDVPLLFEAKLDKWTNPVIVVWVDHETQLQRLKGRDGISDEEAHNKINAQMPLDLKRNKADIVIDNNGTLEDLNEQVKKVLHLVTRRLTWRENMRSRQAAEQASTSAKADLAKTADSGKQSATGIEDLFSDLPSLEPAAPAQSQKDAKSDIMSLFEKPSMVSSFALHQQQLLMLAQQQSLLMAAAAQSANGSLKTPANMPQTGLNGSNIAAQNWPNVAYQVPGMTVPLMNQNDMQKLMQQMGNYQAVQNGGNPSSLPAASFYNMTQPVPVNGMAVLESNKHPVQASISSSSSSTSSTQPTKEYDFSSLTQGLFSKR